MTLPEFLLARYAEDEAVQNGDGGWPYGDSAWHAKDCISHRTDRVCDCEVRDRLIADRESKRQIVEWYQDAVADQGGVDEDSGHAFSAAYEMSCRALALAYAGHPDYRKEWRP